MKRVPFKRITGTPLFNFAADLAFLNTKHIILVLVDLFNQHTKLFLIKNKSSEETYKTLHTYFSGYGLHAPNPGVTLYTDLGKEFIPPDDLKYKYIKHLHPGKYVETVANFETGKIEKKHKSNSDTSIPVKIHTHTFNYAAESKIGSFKSRLQKIIEHDMILGKRTRITQNLLSQIESEMNEDKEYFNKPEEMLKPGMYPNERERVLEDDIKKAKFVVGDRVHVKTQKGYLDKKSMMYSWTPFTLTISDRKLVHGFWKYMVKPDADQSFVIDKWFYEDELRT